MGDPLTTDNGQQTANTPLRVLGIDTSLRSTGVGVVEAIGSKYSAVEYGALKNKPKLPLTACFLTIRQGIIDIVQRTTPTAAAIEGAFYHKNARTAMILGQARGVAIATCAELGLPVFEYAPRKVKQAVVGFGGAGKEQVQKMIQTMLAIDEQPQEDAGDALAIAICHLHSQTGYAALMPEPI